MHAGNGGKTTAASSDQGEGGASGGTKKRKRARRLRPQAESSGGQGNEDSGEDLRPGSGEESEDIDLEDEEAINNKETDEDYDPNEGRGYEERDKRENRRLAVRAHDELGAEKRSKRKRTPKGNGEAQKKQSLAPSEDAAYTYVANRDPSVAVLRIRLQGDRMVLDKDFEDAPPVRPPIQNRGGEPGPMSNGEELAKLFERYGHANIRHVASVQHLDSSS